ncbi:C-Maf-inducing protein [Trichinella spiralis]|uniref:C-Maf-inducing protein n=1 Tax=Trichinella spiralis TaxID=6334 RepID=A0ABR3K5G9_TRISP
MHSPQCFESSFSYIIMHHSATSEEVAETWEEDDTGKRLDQVIRRRKKLKEMSEKMEATAHLLQKDGNGVQPEPLELQMKSRLLLSLSSWHIPQLKNVWFLTWRRETVFLGNHQPVFRNGNKVTVPEGIGTRYAPNMKRKS